MPQHSLHLLALCIMGLSACGVPGLSEPDGAVEADAGLSDGGSTSGDDAGDGQDGGAADAGEVDAGGVDVDAGTTDAGATDAGTTDAGTTDAGATDAGDPDAGFSSVAALPATLTVAEDTQGTGQLSATSDAGAAFTFALDQPAARGTATVTATGGFTYAPQANFSGADSFVFRVSDGTSLATGTVTITVTPVNDAPTIAGQQTVSFAEDTTRTLTLADLQVADVDDTTGFTLQVSAGTGFTVSGAAVTPVADFNGSLTVPVTVTDSSGAVSAPFSLSLTVSPVNDAPLLLAQGVITTAEDTARTVTLGDLTVTDVDDTVPNGFTVFLAVGTNYTVSGATVTPAANFSGTLSVPVTVADIGGASSASFALTVTVTPVNDAPVISAQAAAISFAEDTSRALTLTDVTFTDVDSTSGFVLFVGAGANFTVSGTTVTPAANFNGALSVPVTVFDGSATSSSFTLTLTVTPVNDAPSITAQNGATTAEDTARTVTLADLQVTDVDDTYPTGFTLIVGDGASYTRTVASITPSSNFVGTLSVPVSVRDAGGASSNTFSLQVTVSAVNDAPLITGQTTVSFGEDTPRALAVTDLTVTDVDSPSSSFVLSVGAGSNYTVSGTTVTPAANFNGLLTIPVTVSDGTNTSAVFNLSATVTAVNDAPVITAHGTLRIDEDTTRTLTLADLTVTDVDHTPPTGFTVSLAAGTNYTVNGAVIMPAANFSGTLTVPVTVTDPSNAASWPFDVTVTVTPVNDAPSITGQATVSFAEDTSRALALGDLTITDVDNTPPTGFTLTVNGGTNYTVSGTTVTPAQDFNGTLSVPVTVSDGTTSSGTRVLTLTVTAVNDAPVINRQNTVSTAEDTARTVTTADLVITDVDNTTFTVLVLAGTNYSFSGASFTPALNYNGAMTVNVRVSDGTANSNTFALAVTVTAVNDAPAAVADSYAANGNTLLTAATSVLANDSDVESASSTLVVSASDALSSRGGTVTMAMNGTFTYLPPVGAVSVTDTFTYTVRDPDGATTVGTVSVSLVAPRVWYVDNTRMSGDGRSSSPMPQLSTALGLSGPGDIFFIWGGGAAYSVNAVLQTGQVVLGRPAGLTLANAAPIVGNTMLARPVLQLANGMSPLVTLATNAVVRHVNLNATSTGTAVLARNTSTNTVQSVTVTTAKVAFDLGAVTGMAIDGVTSTSLADSVLRVPDGSFVDGLSLTNSSFSNVGDAIGDKALNFGSGFLTGVGPIRNTVTLQNLTVTATGQDGLFVEAAGNAGTLILDNVNLSAVNNGGFGLLVRADAVSMLSPTLTVTVRNNSVITVGPSGDAINAAAEGSGAATLTLDVLNTTLNAPVGQLADDGVRVTADGLNSRVNVRVLNSTLQRFGGRAVAMGSSADGALLQARVENNTVNTLGPSSTGLLVETMNTTTTARVAAAFRGNTVTSGSGGAVIGRARTSGMGGRLDLELQGNVLEAVMSPFGTVELASVATGLGCLAMSGNTVNVSTWSVALGEVAGSTLQLEGTSASVATQLTTTNTLGGPPRVDMGVSLAPLNTCIRPSN